MQVGIGKFQKLQKEMLNLNFIMGLRQSKPGRLFQCLSAGIVQFSYQRFQVRFCHASLRFFKMIGSRTFREQAD